VANIMDSLFKILKTFLSLKPVYKTGPNTLEELLKQFDQPPKEKSEDDIIRDFLIRDNMAALEVDMLKMDPPIKFNGTQIWYEGDVKCFDFVPCVVRPEVPYCSYGKN